MNSKDINYTVLDNSDVFNAKKPFLNRLTGVLPQPLRFFALFVILIMMVIFIISVPLALFLLLTISFTYNALVGTLMITIMTLGIILLYIRQRRSEKIAKAGIQEFARQNSWTFGPIGELIQNFHGDNSIQSARNYDVTLYSIKGQLRSHDFELLVGWKAAYNQPLEPLTPELFIKSSKPLPSAVLVSRYVTDGIKFLDKMFVTYDKPMPISLEGDFDKYFQLYIPQGEQINALSLIAPDFMQTVILFSKTLTIELSHSGFALVPIHSDTLTKNSAIEMFSAAEKILSETDY